MGWLESPPVATAVIDAVLGLFAALLPLKDQATATRIVAEAFDATCSSRLARNIGRKAAVNVILRTGIVNTLRSTMTKTGGRKEGFRSEKVQERVAELVKVRSLSLEFQLATNVC